MSAHAIRVDRRSWVFSMAVLSGMRSVGTTSMIRSQTSKGTKRLPTNEGTKTVQLKLFENGGKDHLLLDSRSALPMC